MFLGIYTFFSRLSNPLAHNCLQRFLMSVCISVILVVTSLFWFYLFGASYLLMSLNKGLSVWSFQRTCSSLLVFLVSISHISALVFIIFFLALTSGFIFLLWCIAGEIGALPLWGKPLSFPPLQLLTCECAVLCYFSPVVLAHRWHCCWNCS